LCPSGVYSAYTSLATRTMITWSTSAAGLDTMALTLTLRKHYTAREHVEQAIREEQRKERLAYLKGRLDELAEAGR
jgi:hypothetical protein